MKRLLAVAVVAIAGIMLAPAPAALAASGAYWCFPAVAPYYTHMTGGGCRPEHIKVPVGATETQVLTVTATNQASTYATFNGFGLVNGTWTHVWGPWTARIGYNGFASVGQKAEGDGKTPQGTYGIQFMFGVNANPGVHSSYRLVNTYDYWNDDPASPNYNLWVDTQTTGLASAGNNPEPMYQTPFYNYGAVIKYNVARVPGAGSAIFLHVTTGGDTAGCVALPQNDLLQVLRWLRPSAGPRIAMGVVQK